MADSDSDSSSEDITSSVPATPTSLTELVSLTLAVCLKSGQMLGLVSLTDGHLPFERHPTRCTYPSCLTRSSRTIRPTDKIDPAHLCISRSFYAGFSRASTRRSTSQTAGSVVTPSCERWSTCPRKNVTPFGSSACVCPCTRPTGNDKLRLLRRLTMIFSLSQSLWSQLSSLSVFVADERPGVYPNRHDSSFVACIVALCPHLRSLIIESFIDELYYGLLLHILFKNAQLSESLTSIVEKMSLTVPPDAFWFRSPDRPLARVIRLAGPPRSHPDVHR
jgi:hypothetical protein